MPSWEDMSAFYRSTDFSEDVIYKAGGVGGGVTIQGIFDAPDDTQFGVGGTQPKVRVKASDITSFSNSDTFTIRGLVYRCIDDKPIDDGAELIIPLEKQ